MGEMKQLQISKKGFLPLEEKSLVLELGKVVVVFGISYYLQAPKFPHTLNEGHKITFA
jgi:hypothetical protein